MVIRRVTLRNRPIRTGSGIGLEVVYPDHRDGAAGPHAGEGVVERGVEGHGVDDRVGPASAGGLHHRLHRRPLDRDRPGVGGQGPATGDRVDGQHPAGAQGEGGTHGAESDRAEARGPPRCRPAGCRPASPRSSRCPGCRSAAGRPRRPIPVGDGQHLEVGRRAPRPRWPGRHRERPGAEHLGAVDAGDRVTGGAAVAAAAPGHRRRQHPVTDGEPLHGPARPRPPCR